MRDHSGCWTLAECKASARANSRPQDSVVIAHTDDECFVWVVKGAEWTFNVTDEDIIEIWPPHIDKDERHTT